MALTKLDDKLQSSGTLNTKPGGKVVFVFPVIIMLFGIAAYFSFIPKICGNSVLRVEMLFSNPWSIINDFFKLNVILPEANSIIGIRIFWYVWLALFCSSLFAVGKKLHGKPTPNTTNIITQKEACLVVQSVGKVLMQIKRQQKSKKFNTLIYEVKCLEEKLSVESDFGYGSIAVINCENNIACQLRFLIDTSERLKQGNVIESIDTLNETISNINFLLCKRMELKKR